MPGRTGRIVLDGVTFDCPGYRPGAAVSDLDADCGFVVAALESTMVCEVSSKELQAAVRALREAGITAEDIRDIFRWPD